MCLQFLIWFGFCFYDRNEYRTGNDFLVLGEGHYAVVKLARHVFTGEKVAVKVIDKQKLDQSTQTQMLQEVKLMKLVQHPNVVRLYEVSRCTVRSSVLRSQSFLGRLRAFEFPPASTFGSHFFRYLTSKLKLSLKL